MPCTGGGCQRSTSVRKQRVTNNVVEVQEPREQEQVPLPTEQVPLLVEEVSVHWVGSFPGGPEDLSVLRSFPDHVAARLWSGEVIKLIFCWILVFCYKNSYN